jgi:CheY-like chemotaxis protein
LLPVSILNFPLKDHGIGIPKEFLVRIFEPYYTTKSEGQGLGLASCYSILRRHDGCIDVESEPGKGSTFHLYLPASTKASKLTKKEKTTQHKGQGTFLVMDDEESIRKITKKMVELFGYDVILTNNGQEAIDAFMDATNENKKFAGMIFDLTVKGNIGGEEAINEIRKICNETPAFVASGYSGDPIMADPQKHGFTASICKPFTKAELSELLEKYLNTETKREI